MDFRMMHPADQIVTIMNRLYYYGMTTTTGGNLSVRDGDGTVWISPSGVDKGSLRREDIVRITPEGEIVGHHKPSVEYPFHLAIYRHRPDLRVQHRAQDPRYHHLPRRAPSLRKDRICDLRLPGQQPAG